MKNINKDFFPKNLKQSMRDEVIKDYASKRANNLINFFNVILNKSNIDCEDIAKQRFRVYRLNASRSRIIECIFYFYKILLNERIEKDITAEKYIDIVVYIFSTRQPIDLKSQVSILNLNIFLSLTFLLSELKGSEKYDGIEGISDYIRRYASDLRDNNFIDAITALSNIKTALVDVSKTQLNDYILKNMKNEDQCIQ